MISNGSAVVAITPDLIRYADGLAYRRTPPSGPVVPVWDFMAQPVLPATAPKLRSTNPTQCRFDLRAEF